jgi:hypothetical protein
MKDSPMSRQQLGRNGIEGVVTTRLIEGNVYVYEHISTASGGDSNEITLLVMKLTN